MEITVFFHRPYFSARFQQRRGQGAQAGTDFNDHISRNDAGKFQRFPDDVPVDEKILSEELLRFVAEADE
jgi:hypothetical protein